MKAGISRIQRLGKIERKNEEEELISHDVLVNLQPVDLSELCIADYSLQKFPYSDCSLG